uniref:Uncharacterized protein n=1 Tax=Tetranychus urticae TaxID=32264 RepID=T1K0Y2_TETUR
MKTFIILVVLCSATVTLAAPTATTDFYTDYTTTETAITEYTMTETAATDYTTTEFATLTLSAKCNTKCVQIHSDPRQQRRFDEQSLRYEIQPSVYNYYNVKRMLVRLSTLKGSEGQIKLKKLGKTIEKTQCSAANSAQFSAYIKINGITLFYWNEYRNRKAIEASLSLMLVNYQLNKPLASGLTLRYTHEGSFIPGWHDQPNSLALFSIQLASRSMVSLSYIGMVYQAQSKHVNLSDDSLL